MDAITVKQLNTYVKAVLEGDRNLADIRVRGEISNFKNHSSGHFYFNLKYDGAVIRAVMFRSSAARIRFAPRDGMLVTARGRVSVFERDGVYQMYVEEMTADGQGDLFAAFELLKARLSEEGLFDPARKKPIPRIPLRVAVITSPTGAAVRDIINVLGRRFPTARVMLYPVLVQGEGAAPQICEAIRCCDSDKIADVIIVGRGGGSIEDLWAFNEESVARAIAAAQTPVISAVGHETDFTIADFVADLRAPTPSAAAELAVPDTCELMGKFDNVRNRLRVLLNNQLAARRQRIDYVVSSAVFTHPERLTQDRSILLDRACADMTNAMRLRCTEDRSRLAKAAGKLDSLSPLAVLGRGFSFIRNEEGGIISSVGQLSPGQRLSARLADGAASLTVNEISEDYRNNG